MDEPAREDLIELMDKQIKVIGELTSKREPLTKEESERLCSATILLNTLTTFGLSKPTD